MRPGTTLAVAVLLLCLLGAAVTQFFFLARDASQQEEGGLSATPISLVTTATSGIAEQG